MMAVKVESSYGEGLVGVEDWADPRCYLLDISLENGDTMPVEKEKLKFLAVEEF